MIKAFKTKLKQWFGNRMPRGDRVKLGHRSTYIWPTATGYLLLGIIILMLIGATNYQNNLAFLLTFLVVGLGLVCVLLTYKNIRGIEFLLSPVEEAFAGQSVNLKVSLHSIDGNEHKNVGIGENYKKLVFIDVPEQHFSSVEISLGKPERGYYELPRVLVSSIYPFGWFRTWGYVSLLTPVIIFPKPLEPKVIRNNVSGREDEEGVKVAGNDDLYGLKPFQKGESLSRIDWKSYARERGMFMREFASYQSQQLCFNWNDFPGVDVETRLSYLTHLVLEAASLNLNYGLSLPENFVNNDEGYAHRIKCLQALALYQKKPPPAFQTQFTQRTSINIGAK